jgi:four helix bundle protein
MAKRAEELQCWQLADKLRAEVIAICAQEHVARHLRFCDGFTEAAGSICHNIREGFVRFHSGPIIQFFTYALSSLEEVEDYLSEAKTRKFVDDDRFQKDLDSAEHCRASMLNFIRPHLSKLRRKPPPRRRRPGHPTSHRT